MDLDQLYVVTQRLAPAGSVEVARAEELLGTSMPDGYAAFVQRYGPGLVGDLVRVPSPAEVVQDTTDWRELAAEHWFWDTSAAQVEADDLRSGGVALVDTVAGDRVCFIAGRPERSFVLPRDDDEAVAIEGGLAEVLTWLVESGELVRPAPAATFESWSERDGFRYESRGESLGPAVRDDLLALGLHDLVEQADHRLVLYVTSIGGRIDVGDQAVLVRHDPEPPGSELARIVGVLEANGLRRGPA